MLSLFWYLFWYCVVQVSNLLIHVSCCSDDDSVTSLTEFNVQKHTPRYPVSGDVISHDNHVIKSQEPAPRIMALSENCIIERDPATYIVVTVRPLSEV